MRLTAYIVVACLVMGLSFWAGVLVEDIANALKVGMILTAVSMLAMMRLFCKIPCTVEDDEIKSALDHIKNKSV